ncbi:Uncharacterised protein [Streptococcus pneumoniae]|nr:Uncharacterised protein [Streptococcus pneumoniae]
MAITASEKITFCFTIRFIRFDKRIAWERRDSSFFISTTSAVSKATSVPSPIATPMLAVARAGASFIPSPTIATVPYFSFNFLIVSTFVSGKHDA